MVKAGARADDEGVMLSLFLTWLAISIPAALVVGRMIRNTELDLVPAWDEADDGKFRQWESRQDNVDR